MVGVYPGVMVRLLKAVNFKLILLALTFFTPSSPGQFAFWQIQPPRFEYQFPNTSINKWSPWTNNLVRVGGGPIDSVSISPALPAGLTFDPVTGIISGTPHQSDETGTTYTITATNKGGSTSYTITFGVIIPDFTWLGGNGTGSQRNQWSRGANWKGGVVPTSANTAIFDNEGSAWPTTVDTNTTVRNFQMKFNYASTITQATGITLTVGTEDITTQGSFIMEAGTFVGGDSSINIDFLELIGGNFQSTSGLLTVGMNLGSTNDFNGPDIFRFRAAATFTHRNGTLRFLGITSGGGTATGEIQLDQELLLYNLETESKHPSVGDQRAKSLTFDGISASMRVENEFRVVAGYSKYGTVYLEGPKARFLCVTPTNRRTCSNIPKPGLGSTVSNIAEYTRLLFVGSSAQTYEYQTGAEAGVRFESDNAAGITTPDTGDFAVVGVDVRAGNFSAPASSKFSIGGGMRSESGNPGIGLLVRSGANFLHNNSDLWLEFQRGSNNGGVFLEIGRLGAALELNNLIVNSAGGINGGDDLLGNNIQRIGVLADTTINVNGDLTIKNMAFQRLESTGTYPIIRVFGNLTFECADPKSAPHICTDRSRVIALYAQGAGSTINVASEAPQILSIGTLHIAPGAGNTVTLNSGYMIMPEDSGSSNLNIENGTLHLAAGTGMRVENLSFVSGRITCAAGAFITYYGSLSGTPGSGNDPSCYGTSSSDRTPTAFSSLTSFTGDSAWQLVTGLNGPIELEFSHTVNAGSPTVFYRTAHTAWIEFTGGTTTRVFVPGDELRLRVATTTNDRAQIRVRNLSDSGSPTLVNIEGQGSATPDPTPDAINWANFSGTSSTQTLAGINVPITLGLEALNLSGSPTVQYRLNGGSWTTFTQGSSPATLSNLVVTNTLAFRVTGTGGHSAMITVINQSDGNAVLDTATGTVP